MRLLALSGFTINLKKSNDYVRCALLLHGVAILVLLRSGLSWVAIIPLLMVLMGTLAPILRSKRPLPRYEKLSYHPGYWLLHEVNGSQMKYEHASIGFEGGIFILLTLANNNSKKVLTLFNDQITTEQYRTLKFMAFTKPQK